MSELCVRRLKRELAGLQKKPMDGIEAQVCRRVIPNEECSLEAPACSPTPRPPPGQDNPAHQQHMVLCASGIISWAWAGPSGHVFVARPHGVVFGLNAILVSCILFLFRARSLSKATFKCGIL